MSGHRKWAEIQKHRKPDPDRKRDLAVARRVLPVVAVLRDVRERRGATQRDVAAAMGVSQPNVSRFEHEEDVYLSSLAAYVAALGGRLELRAVFADEVVTVYAGPEPDDEAVAEDARVRAGELAGVNP